MASLNAQQENNLTAFMTALSRQEDPLPSSLQAQLHAIGQNLENRSVELPTIAASLPSLSKAYREAMAEERTDGNATLVSATEQDHSDELLEHATRILTDSDPVKAAQQDLSRVSGLVASNPLKRLFRRG
ncbi:hypothetical protein [Acaryochloris thomasi]|uniref:hypothetical protein n=1 Tax=Acaryochloris thomasi TaxID=2929456 RepID=UPI000DA672E9|nr:hypothetical protein [Acaryochloris thomasi]